MVTAGVINGKQYETGCIVVVGVDEGVGMRVRTC